MITQKGTKPQDNNTFSLEKTKCVPKLKKQKGEERKRDFEDSGFFVRKQRDYWSGGFLVKLE
jgi:hypothetical protein